MRAEISGMTWAGDNLVLLPQYPSRVSATASGALLMIPKQEVLDFLDGKRSEPIEPRLLTLISGGVENLVNGFEGYEAIAFYGDLAYLTIESSPRGKMMSHLVRGRLERATGEEAPVLRLEPETLVNVPLDTQIFNYSNEAIVIHNEQVLLFFEANGAWANPKAQARVYTLDLHEAGTLPLPALEYRLTDADQPDAQGRFWVINVFSPVDVFVIPLSDPLAEQYGRGSTHAQASVVERVVPMQIDDQGQIQIAAQPPVQIQLAEGQVPRNWEGLARFDDRGFLLVTDKFPETILAFVPAQPEPRR